MTLRIELAKPVGKAWGRMGRGVARHGVMLHYDASRSDAGAVAWLEDDERCRVSYHYLVLDDGRILQIAPPESRAWHAGECRPSEKRFTYTDANAAFYGVAIAATDGETATLVQLKAVVELCHYLFWLEGWEPAAESWRITGHNREAWPRGRKVDPVGSDPRNPVLSVDLVRAQLVSSEWTGIS